ncbi:bifunctional P-loop containing nucleoside triphosphate hydrolase/AAA+ ATPase domain/ATPase [Babesia duncani]|uniref:Midasin n=1 Tax=Babesia duncani TaxID=323732 RepID=A0AAD9PKI6_9APIC|nr:bifunctional P-loop containing nucleoside triphosphate hydrolase/AAA+ ATPase domain/ATPase [Babesia duncani]
MAPVDDYGAKAKILARVFEVKLQSIQQLLKVTRGLDLLVNTTKSNFENSRSEFSTKASVNPESISNVGDSRSFGDSLQCLTLTESHKCVVRLQSLLGLASEAAALDFETNEEEQFFIPDTNIRSKVEINTFDASTNNQSTCVTSEVNIYDNGIDPFWNISTSILDDSSVAEIQNAINLGQLKSQSSTLEYLQKWFHSPVDIYKCMGCLLKAPGDKRYLITAALLNPFMTHTIIASIPSTALVLLLDILNGNPFDDFVLERLLVAKRFITNVRFKRYCNYFISKTVDSQSLGDLITRLLSQSVPERLFCYRAFLFYNIQPLLSQVNIFKAFNQQLDDKRQQILRHVLPITLPTLQIKTLCYFKPCKISISNDGSPCNERMITIGHHVGFKRTLETKVGSFVTLPYSQDVLSDMFSKVDFYIGIRVIGTAKKFHICELANRIGIQQVNEVYLDGSTDIKTLVGGWQCTCLSGEFEFIPGILTLGMEQGRWLIFDAQLPESIVALLNDICTTGKLYIPETLQTIYAHPNFNIFIIFDETKDCTRGYLKLPFVYIPPPQVDHIKEIIIHQYPRLAALVDRIVDAYEAVESTVTRYMPLKKVSHILKICKRLQASEFTYDGYLSTTIKGFILECIYTVIIAGISCKDVRNELLKKVGSHFGITPTACLDMLPINQINPTDSDTSIHSKILQQLMSCFINKESALLVGETGTGKTAIVQRFAKMTDNDLVVYVFNEQSEACDLIGNFLPDNVANTSCTLLIRAIELHLKSCIINKDLFVYFDHLVAMYKSANYQSLLKTLSMGLGVVSGFMFSQLGAEINFVISQCNMAAQICPNIKFPFVFKALYKSIESLTPEHEQIINKYKGQVSCDCSKRIKFKFQPGILVEAMRRGQWLLLDEINLASKDLLQRLIGIVGGQKQFELYECGCEIVNVHSNFRLFACMNPPLIKQGGITSWTSGKKHLPLGFRCNFTEMFVDEVDSFEDVLKIVKYHLNNTCIDIASDISNLYLSIKALCNEQQLEDGSFKTPVFSLRNLVRAIDYIKNVTTRTHSPIHDKFRALFDAFMSTFGSCLGSNSLAKFEKLLFPCPPKSIQIHATPKHLVIQGYLLAQGNGSMEGENSFIVTPSVELNLKKLCRIISGSRVPILLEGPTATGKTSLVEYLCHKTGHTCVRINNHEHTDVSDYLGQFVFNSKDNQLHFNHGPLVDAMKNGHWVILDELNLAPSQVLEALNRILDDNRQVYIPETCETITAHKDFMVFATQNPANTVYGGRKQLSRAFCNRFIQIYMQAPSTLDLELILHHKCKIPLSRAQRIVKVYQELQLVPMNSLAFDRHSTFVTLRDLVKWARRVATNDEGLAQYGWCIIGEKLRCINDKERVKTIIERHCLNQNLDPSSCKPPKVLNVDFVKSSIKIKEAVTDLEHFVWIPGVTDRLVTLVLDAINNGEPILLIGETGIGKTTVCQVLATLLGAHLHVFNFHKNTEASDFIGGFRPNRQNARLYSSLWKLIDHLGSLSMGMDKDVVTRQIKTLKDIAEKHSLNMTKDELQELLTSIECSLSLKRKLNPSVHVVEEMIQEILSTYSGSPFEWVDGPLVRCMEHGEWFLADEISLADDAVLEKMNSVLEIPGTLSIPEAGNQVLRRVQAHPQFRFLATMNPGGDHGKRELSPALLNRFTIVHVPEIDVSNPVLVSRLCMGLPDWIPVAIVKVVESCKTRLTLRDLVVWINYIRTSTKFVHVFIHGAHVAFMDHLDAPISLDMLLEIVSECTSGLDQESIQEFKSFGWVPKLLKSNGKGLVIGDYNLHSDTTLGTMGRLIRALEIKRPILIEGEPGVGKTAAVHALARLYGKSLLRVNLSEHTDLMDLLGSDMPCIVNGKWGFSYKNGPLLQAMASGDWILLDELNLANQQVLEGLNAILDHRRETFIPELSRLVQCHADFRLFGSQNPPQSGGGRRHLPKSFLNRFTKIHAGTLSIQDCFKILSSRFPAVDSQILHRFLHRLHELKETLPEYEWNLRNALTFFSIYNPKHGDFEATFRLVLLGRVDFKKLPPHFGSSNAIYQVFYTRKGMDLKLHQNIRLAPTLRLSSLVHCMHRLVPVPLLVTGPSNSGKISSIYQFAQSMNKELVEIRLYPNCEAADLLGNFEHASLQSLKGEIKQNLEQMLEMVQLLDNGCELRRVFFNLLNKLNLECQGGIDDFAKEFQSIEFSPNWTAINELKQRLLHQIQLNKANGSFRWIDSQLIRAMVKGDWVVIPRIDRIDPAILDRLNPVIEERGELRLNESGDTSVIVPHKNFRLFMTANDTFIGKISRAFRNRCIELNMAAFGGLCVQISFTCDLSKRIQELLPFEFHLDCMQLIDGILIANLQEAPFNNAFKMALVNCTIQCVLDRVSPNVPERMCDPFGWNFLKHWSSLDLPLEEGLIASLKGLPMESLDVLLTVAPQCLKLDPGDCGLKIRKYLAYCQDNFNDVFYREEALVHVFKFEYPIKVYLWFFLRLSTPTWLRVKMLNCCRDPNFTAKHLEHILQQYHSITSCRNDLESSLKIYMLLYAILKGYFVHVVNLMPELSFAIQESVFYFKSVNFVARILDKTILLGYIMDQLKLAPSAKIGIACDVVTCEHLAKLQAMSIYSDLLNAPQKLAHKFNVVMVGNPIYTMKDAMQEVWLLALGPEQVDWIKQCTNAMPENSHISRIPLETPPADANALVGFIVVYIMAISAWTAHEHLIGNTQGDTLHRLKYCLNQLSIKLPLIHVKLPYYIWGTIDLISKTLESKGTLGASNVYRIIHLANCVYRRAMLDPNIKLEASVRDLITSLTIAKGFNVTNQTYPMPHLFEDCLLLLTSTFWQESKYTCTLGGLESFLNQIELIKTILLSMNGGTPRASILYAMILYTSPIIAKVLNIEEKQVSQRIVEGYKFLTTTCVGFTLPESKATATAPKHAGTNEELKWAAKFIMDNLNSPPAQANLWTAVGLLLIWAKPNFHLIFEVELMRLSRDLQQEGFTDLQQTQIFFNDLDMLAQGHVSNLMDSWIQQYYSGMACTKGDEYPLRCLNLFGSNSIGIKKEMDQLAHDLDSFVNREGFKGQCLKDVVKFANFSDALAFKYLAYGEVLRPLQLGLDALIFGAKVSQTTKVQARIIGKMQIWPLNPLMRHKTSELIAIARHFANSDLYLFARSLCYWYRFNLLVPPSFEILKHTFTLVTALIAQTRLKVQESSNIRMSLFQKCLMGAKDKTSNEEIVEILQPQYETVFTILKNEPIHHKCQSIKSPDVLEDQKGGMDQELARELAMLIVTYTNFGHDARVATRESSSATLAICLHLEPNGLNLGLLDNFLAYNLFEQAREFHFPCTATVTGGANGEIRSRAQVDLATCQEVLELLDNLHTRCKSLGDLSIGMDHLNAICTILNSASRAKMRTLTNSVMVILLEHILDRVSDWNKIAHSGISLKEYSAQLQDFVLRMRRMELEDWKNLAIWQYNKCAHEVYEHFTTLVEMCSAMYRSEKAPQELFDFILHSPIAYFDTIICMLKTVSIIFKDSNVPYEVEMSRVMKNFANFSMVWSPMIHAALTRAKDKMANELGSIMCTINWNLVNYVALCESIDKHRRWVSNALRKYESEIRRPIAPIYKEHAMASTLEPLEVPPDCTSVLVELLAQNSKYMHENSFLLNRSQLARIAQSVHAELLQDGIHAYRMDLDNVLEWFDFTLANPNVKSGDFDKILTLLHETINVLMLLKTRLDNNDLLKEHFYRSIECGLVGQLFCMLKATQEKLQALALNLDSWELQSLSVPNGSELFYPVTVEMFERLLMLVDEMYLGLEQGGTEDAQLWESSLYKSILLITSRIKASREYRIYNLCRKNPQALILVSAEYLHHHKMVLDEFESCNVGALLFRSFLKELKPQFKNMLSMFESTSSSLTPGNVTGTTNFQCPHFPMQEALECRYLAAFISALAIILAGNLVQEEKIQNSDQIASGLGFEDGTGITNCNIEELDQDLLDNFGQQNSESTRGNEPREQEGDIDVDFDFDGQDERPSDNSQDASDHDDGDQSGSGNQPETGEYYQHDANNSDELDDARDQIQNVEGAPVFNDDSQQQQQQGELGENDGDCQDDLDDLQQQQGELGENDGDCQDDLDDLQQQQGELGENDGDCQDDLDDSQQQQQQGELGENDGDCQDDHDDSQQQQQQGELGENDGDCQDDHDDLQQQQQDKASEARARDSSQTLEPCLQSADYGVQGNFTQDLDGGCEGPSAPCWSWWQRRELHSSPSSTIIKDFMTRLPNQEPRNTVGSSVAQKNIVNDPLAPREEIDTDLYSIDNDSNSAEGMGTGYATRPDLQDIQTFQKPKFVNEPIPKVHDQMDGHLQEPTTQGDMQFQTLDDLEPLNVQNEHHAPPEDMEFDSSVVESGNFGPGKILESTDIPIALDISSDSPIQQTNGPDGNWRYYQSETLGAAVALCEQLKIILEPTDRGGLEGFYKTGKRISIRKLMSFIASNYQRDRIWMRRTRLSKHDYHIILALDNSKSMQECNAGPLTLKAFATIYGAMQRAQIGEFSLVKFGRKPHFILDSIDGDPEQVIKAMTFDEETRTSHETGMPSMLQCVLCTMSDKESRRILVIVSDGRFTKSKVRPWVQALIAANIVPLLVIVDANANGSKSILCMKQVEQFHDRLVIEPFLANFCFPYYALVQDVQLLPGILSDLIRQWFQAVQG